MNPDPFTLSALIRMSEARLRKQWDHTSTILALLFNMNRDPRKTSAKAPADFHPYTERRPRGTPITSTTLRMMKGLFVKPGAKSGAKPGVMTKRK